MEWIKIYLPIYIVIYLLLTFLLPSYKTWKKTGINPVTFGKRDNAHDFIGVVMKQLIALLVFMVIVFATSETVYHYFVPIGYLEYGWLKYAGLIFVHASLLWIMVAQVQMKESWRIGIDEIHKTTLVTKGVFSVSRNPIFLGMLVSMAGIFFILPNAISMFLVLATYIVIQIQIRLEEEYLQRTYGDTFLAYKTKTRRLM